MSSRQRCHGACSVAPFQRLDQFPVVMRAGRVALLVVQEGRGADIGADCSHRLSTSG